MELLRYLFRFDGRLNRARLWISIVVSAIIEEILDVLAPLAEQGLGIVVSSIVNSGFSLALLLSAISFQVRRLHDRDKAAWWLFIYLVPLLLLAASVGLNAVIGIGIPKSVIKYFVWLSVLPLTIFGLWVVIEILFLRGTDGPNRYGPDPLASTQTNVALQPVGD